MCIRDSSIGVLVHCRLDEVLELMYPEIHVVTRDEWVRRDRW